MSSSRITINGQHYDSVEAMPPAVRRQYEAALRMMANARAGESNEVLTATDGNRFVTSRTVTVINRSLANAGPLPAELRALAGQDQAGAGTQVVVHTRRPEIRASVPIPRPGQRPAGDAGSWYRDPRLRHGFHLLIFWVVVALILWILLGR